MNTLLTLISLLHSFGFAATITATDPRPQMNNCSAFYDEPVLIVVCPTSANTAALYITPAK